MKERIDWDEEYILNLPVGEFDWLEVKGRNGLDLTLPSVKESDVKSNISKAISAFANSGGGALILGLKNPNHVWEVDDGGINLEIKKPTTKEWLEDIIPNLVDLPLTKFNIYSVKKKESTSQIADGRGIFIVEIPGSEQAPHQALDNKYYIRVGGKSRPIGHRLVSDIFGRKSFPKIQLEFAIQESFYKEKEILPLTYSFSKTNREEKPLKRKCELIVEAENIGKVYALYVNVFLNIPMKLATTNEIKYSYINKKNSKTIEGIEYYQWSRMNTRRDIIKSEVMGRSEYGSSWFDPILPSLSFVWERDIFEDFSLEKYGDLKIFWEVYADNAPPEKGLTFFRDIKFLKAE